MTKIEKITTINIDSVPHVVAELSDTVQKMVDLFDDWNQRESDARAEVTLLGSAKNELSRQIIAQVRTDVDESAEPANDAEAVDAEAAVSE